MHVLVIGSGNGGLATAVELTLSGHEVTLYARSERTLAPLRAAGIGYRGVLGEGRLRVARFSHDLAEAIDGADVAVIALPTFAHAGVANALVDYGWGGDRPIILNPGHTGGAFEVETVFKRRNARIPPIAEFSTLAYVARKPEPDTIGITGRARKLRAAALPGGEEALELALELFPGSYDTGSVLASDLSNVNMVIHPPGAMLAAAWIESTRGDFTFYVEGMTEGVVSVMSELDAERRAVASALGCDLPTIIGEMKLIGTVPKTADDDDYMAIAAGEANRRIKAPDSLSHRYYTEDFAHGLVPMQVYAEIAGVPVPVTSALIRLHASMSRHLPAPSQRNAEALGAKGLSRRALIERAGV